MKMIIIKEVLELPMNAKEVGTVLVTCNKCGNKVKHRLFEVEDVSIISCPICKIKWEVTFHDARGQA